MKLIEWIGLVVVACSISFIFVCVTLSIAYTVTLVRDVQDLQTRVTIIEEVITNGGT